MFSPGLGSGIHTAPDRIPEGRGAWWGRHQGVAVHEQLWKSCNGLVIQISPHFFFGSRRQGGARVRRCGRWDGAGKGREQKAADWKQDRGYCTQRCREVRHRPSPEGVSSRPEDGNPAPSAFSPLTTLPCVT